MVELSPTNAATHKLVFADTAPELSGSRKVPAAPVRRLPASLTAATLRCSWSQAGRLQELLEEQGTEFLETYRVPLLSYEEAQALKATSAPALEAAAAGVHVCPATGRDCHEDWVVCD